jgi:hypothetical protein
MRFFETNDSGDLHGVAVLGGFGWENKGGNTGDADRFGEATGPPRGLRSSGDFGPTPNLTQLHDSYKRQALKHSRSRFDELAQNKCGPLCEGFNEAGVKLHNSWKSSMPHLGKVS